MLTSKQRVKLSQVAAFCPGKNQQWKLGCQLCLHFPAIVHLPASFKCFKCSFCIFLMHNICMQWFL